VAVTSEQPAWATSSLRFCGFTRQPTPQLSTLACAQQVHGAEVHVVTGPPAPAVGDGLWTTTPGLHVAVRVADCVPVLLWAPDVPAVAAVHAGWRGTAQDVVGAAVRVGRDRLGVKPSSLLAALGPSIGPCCFEVGDEVVEGLRALGLSGGQIGQRSGPSGRPHVDLRAANRALLLRAGLTDSQVEDVGGCTVCSPKRYESFRRDGAASGRMRAVIALALLALALLCGCGGGTAALDEAEVIDRTDRAHQAITEGDGETAELLLRPLLDRRPDDAWLRATLARALHRQGRYREAAVQSRLAIGADPTLWEAAYNLACHHAALGERDEAISWLQAALAFGHLRAEDVLADPDLAPLEEDHRFAFYSATGVLSRQEEDAIAVLQQPSVQVGEPATVTLVSIALNRPLMASRDPVRVQWRGTRGAALQPVSRRETFSVGSEAGREYHQRTIHYTFVALEPGLLPLGPFELTRDGRSRYTGTLLLDVREGPEPAKPVSVPGVGGVDLFFRAPALDDGRLMEAHAARGGTTQELDILAELAPDLAWATGAEAASRHLRFRAVSLEELPRSVPAREDGVFRSILVRRGTEGWSHIVEVKAAESPAPDPR
jgi:hypothetical protein